MPHLSFNSRTCLSNMLQPESVLLQLRGIEKRLVKAPVKDTAHQAETLKLEEAGFPMRLEPHQVEKTEEAWYIPHDILHHNRKNQVVYKCSFQYQGKNLNELLLPDPALGPSLLAVLLHFKEPSIFFSGDIGGMFSQVWLLLKDRPLKQDSLPFVYEWK